MSCGTCGIQASNTMQDDTGVPAGAPQTQQPRCQHCNAFISQEGAPCNNPRCPRRTGAGQHLSPTAAPQPPTRQAGQGGTAVATTRRLQRLVAAAVRTVAAAESRGPHEARASAHTRTVARDALKAARQALAGLPASARPPRLLQQLYTATGLLALKASNWDDALTAYGQALVHARNGGTPTEQAQLLLEMGRMHYKSARYDKALPLLLESAQLLQQVRSASPHQPPPPELRAALYLARGSATTASDYAPCLQAGLDLVALDREAQDFWAASQNSAAAVALAEESGDPALLTTALRTHCQCLQDATAEAQTAGEWARARRFAAEHVQTAQTLAAPLPLATAHLARARYHCAALVAHESLDDETAWPQLRSDLAAALDLTAAPTEPGGWAVRGEAAALRVGLAYAAQDYPAARRDYATAITAWRKAGQPAQEAAVTTGLATIHHLSGQMARADALYRQALSLYESTGNTRDHAMTCLHYANFLSDRHQPQEAAAYQSQCHTLCEQAGLDTRAIQATVQQFRLQSPRSRYWRTSPANEAPGRRRRIRRREETRL